MISFTIAHDIPGRMRIRYGKDVFSPVEGEVLKRDLSNWTMIHNVEVNSITGSVLMQYDATCKDTLLKKLHNLNLGYLKEADTSDIVFRSHLYLSHPVAEHLLSFAIRILNLLL